MSQPAAPSIQEYAHQLREKYKGETPAFKCGNHYHFRPHPSLNKWLTKKEYYPEWEAHAAWSDKDPQPPDKAYVRDGHADDPRPFRIDHWLECGLCALTKDRQTSYCYSEKHHEWQQQYFRAEDLSRAPWKDHQNPPSYNFAVATSSTGPPSRPPPYGDSGSAMSGRRAPMR